MTIRRRAINENQKLERRQTILETTLSLFKKSSYDTISIEKVAKQSGIAKGTVYLYFKTKEALFLALQAQAFTAWFDEIDQQLAKRAHSPKPDQVEDIAHLIVTSLEKHQILVKLISISNTILEHNIDYDTATSFKRLLLQRVSTTGPLLEACLPHLEAGEGIRLLLHTHALVIGLKHMAEPAPIVNQVLDNEADLGVLKIDFSGEFFTILMALIQKQTKN